MSLEQVAVAPSNFTSAFIKNALTPHLNRESSLIATTSGRDSKIHRTVGGDKNGRRLQLIFGGRGSNVELSQLVGYHALGGLLG